MSDRDMEEAINAVLGEPRLGREVLVLLPDILTGEYDLYVVTKPDRIELARRAAGLQPLSR